MLLSDKVDFRLKSTRRDNEGQFILMKGTIHQEEISILNIYAPNTGAPIYIKKTLMALRVQINSNSVIVEELRTSLSPIDRSFRQKINKANPHLDQIDTVGIYRVFHPASRQYTFFSATHGTSPK
jgi:hypothetical protein